MRQFSGLQYLAIDIANQYGLDKESWDTRIQWVKDNMDNLENLEANADNEILYRKAVKTLRNKNKSTGFIMALDATASGLQIMSALSGCKKSAEAVNLINTGKREDVYSYVANHMNQNYGTNVDRNIIKRPLMTVFYGSKKKPKEIFGEDTPELKAFYSVLEKDLTGPTFLMFDMLELWNKNKLVHEWTLPDGHKARIKSFVPINLNISDENINFSFTTYSHEPSPNGTNIIANIVHSIDGYIAREMVRRANKQGFQLVHIHDSFWSHPNHMNWVRFNYINILAEIAKSSLFEDIASELLNKKVKINKLSNDLWKDIIYSEYPLS